MTAGKPGIRMRLKLQADGRIQQFPQHTQGRRVSSGRLVRPEPELWLLFERFDEQTVVEIRNPAQSFRCTPGMIAVSGADCRGQPVLGKMVVRRVGLAPKRAQDAAALIASPDRIWGKERGGQQVTSHGS